MAEGETVLGMTLLAGELYLVRWKERDQVEVYDVISYHLLRRLTVPDSPSVSDVTSCEHYRCVYIGDNAGECVHKLDKQGSITRWAVNDKIRSLSVNAAHNVIVMCAAVHKIKEFSSHGDLLRELTISNYVINPSHAIQTCSGHFIVCHGSPRAPVHRVCMIGLSADGCHIVHSHGGWSGSGIDQYDVPHHLAVDDNEFVFVADFFNRRVTLLSPTLQYVRQVVSRDQLKWLPCSVCLDTQRRLLYIADNDFILGKLNGRVVVVRV